MLNPALEIATWNVKIQKNSWWNVFKVYFNKAVSKTGEGLLDLCGITVDAQLDSGGGMKRDVLWCDYYLEVANAISWVPDHSSKSFCFIFIYCEVSYINSLLWLFPLDCCLPSLFTLKLHVSERDFAGFPVFPGTLVVFNEWNLLVYGVWSGSHSGILYYMRTKLLNWRLLSPFIYGV